MQKMATGNARVGLYLDVSNLVVSTKEVHGETAMVDFKRLLHYAEGLGKLCVAAAFTSINPTGNGNSSLLMTLKSVGYTHVVGRVQKQLPDGRFKCDLDATLGFALGQDLMVHRLQKVTIVTGDGDFTGVVEALQHQHVEVTVVGPTRRTASELIIAAHHFHYLHELELITSGKASRAERENSLRSKPSEHAAQFNGVASAN